MSGGISEASAAVAYAAKGATNLSASLINLANPGVNNATNTPLDLPTWDVSGGWNFAGSQGLLTGLTLMDNCTIIVKFSNYGENTAAAMCGAADGGPKNVSVLCDDGSNKHCYFWGNIDSRAAPKLASGVMAINKTGGFLNGNREKTFTATWSAITETFTIGTLSGIGWRFHGKIQAVAVYNVTISDAQILAVTTAMNLL